MVNVFIHHDLETHYEQNTEMMSVFFISVLKIHVPIFEFVGLNLGRIAAFFEVYTATSLNVHEELSD